MRLWELFEDITANDIRNVERTLDDRLYQPAEKIRTNQPVLDLDLPTDQHFMQRIVGRSDKAKITPNEIANLLARAKIDGSLGFKDELNQAAVDGRPGETINVQDPKTKLTIPLVVDANPACKPNSTSPDNPVCGTAQGKQPKNIIRAKTIFRKGVED
jgi:hypothetical protein